MHTSEPHCTFGGHLHDWSENPLLSLLDLPPRSPIVFRHVDGRVGVPLLHLESPDAGASLLRNADSKIYLPGINRVTFGVRTIPYNVLRSQTLPQIPGSPERYPALPISESGGDFITLRSLFMSLWAEARLDFRLVHILSSAVS